MAKGSSEGQGFQALLEQVRSELKVVAEGHSGLERQIQQTGLRLEQRILGVEQRIGYVEQAVGEGFAKTRESFAGVNKRIDRLVERFDAHEQLHAN